MLFKTKVQPTDYAKIEHFSSKLHNEFRTVLPKVAYSYTITTLWLHYRYTEGATGENESFVGEKSELPRSYVGVTSELPRRIKEKAA